MFDEEIDLIDSQTLKKYVVLEEEDKNDKTVRYVLIVPKTWVKWDEKKFYYHLRCNDDILLGDFEPNDTDFSLNEYLRLLYTTG